MKRRAKPVSQGSIDGGAQASSPRPCSGTQPLASELMERNADFRAFAARMEATKRSFIVKRTTGEEVVIVPSEDAMNEGVYGEWLDCCLKDYLERKRIFELRHKSRGNLIWLISCGLVVFLCALWFLWPLWEVLIDMETDKYSDILGVSSSASPAEIKKAYREAMRKWHPDRNPTCGEACRLRAMEIQHAQEVLLERGSQRFELAKKYREELHQLRMLVVIRMHSIAANSAQGLYYCVKGLLRGYALDGEGTLMSSACKVFAVLFFFVYETVFISGFNVVLALQVLYNCVAIAKTSVHEQVMNRDRRASYVDMLREVGVVVPLLLLGDILHLSLWPGHAGWMEEIFRMLFGFLYVLSFLYRLTPNIYDNFVLRKCSLPLAYIQLQTRRFSWWSFALAELGILLDDLLVFTCRISWYYRAAVYAIHFVFLCQFFLLPWDGPVRRKEARRNESAPQSRVPHAAPRTPEGDGEAGTKRRMREVRPEEVQQPSRAPTRKEEELIADLDVEVVRWMDVALVKYNRVLRALKEVHQRRSQDQTVSAELAFAADMRSVIVCVFTWGGKGENVPHSPGVKTDSPKVEPVLKTLDPEMSRLIALEKGPQMMVPTDARVKLNNSTVVETYRQQLGAQADLSASGVWRSRLGHTRYPGRSPSAWRELVPGVLCLLACFLVSLSIAWISPTPFQVAMSTGDLANAQRPMIFAGNEREMYLGRSSPAQTLGTLTLGGGRVYACVGESGGSREHTMKSSV